MSFTEPATRLGLTRNEVLAHIAKFPEGLRFTDIQRFIVEWHGYNYDLIERFTSVWSGRKITQRTYRGYWCDNLLGGNIYTNRRGILPLACDRNPETKRYTVKPEVKAELERLGM